MLVGIVCSISTPISKQGEHIYFICGVFSRIHHGNSTYLNVCMSEWYLVPGRRVLFRSIALP